MTDYTDTDIPTISITAIKCVHDHSLPVLKEELEAAVRKARVKIN